MAAIQDDVGPTVFLEQFDEPYTIQVEDVDSLFERLSAASLMFVTEPGKHFWGYGAILANGDGHLLHLYDETSMMEKSS